MQQTILRWYRKQGRHFLPWRKTTDLYKIAVSEVMLQQTNVPKVISRYSDFLMVFPSWDVLAKTRFAMVLRKWQGLGYNRRALYLHRASQSIVKNYGGKLPDDEEALKKLSGFGPYTRAAISVFGRNKDCVARDVNIDRVLRRVQGKKSISERTAQKLAEKFLPRGKSRDWHNALMDLGATICTKRAPQCAVCPISFLCLSFPDPRDYTSLIKKEPGRREYGKHIPRRIYRGRIVEVLRSKRATLQTLGRNIKKDWHSKNDKVWLVEILQKLASEGMIEYKKGRWQLKA